MKKSVIPERSDKIIGTMCGHIVGDTFGVRYQYLTSIDTVRMLSRELEKNDGELHILGGGPSDLVKGQPSDNAELAIIFARTIAENPFNKIAISMAIAQWYFSEPYDTGMSLRRSMIGVTRRTEPDELYAIMKENSSHYNSYSFSTGCLVRIVSVALLGILQDNYTDEKIIKFIHQICKITNPHPIVFDACKVYIFAIRDAIKGCERLQIWLNALKNCGTPLIKRIVKESMARASPTVDTNGIYYRADDPNHKNTIGGSLQFAFHELLNSISFEDGLKNVVIYGGDTTTNCCITGALLGAYYGHDKIPKQWLETIRTVSNPRTNKIINVATDDLVELSLHCALPGLPLRGCLKNSF